VKGVGAGIAFASAVTAAAWDETARLAGRDPEINPSAETCLRLAHRLGTALARRRLGAMAQVPPPPLPGQPAEIVACAALPEQGREALTVLLRQWERPAEHPDALPEDIVRRLWP
jgi:hypothetical protein